MVHECSSDQCREISVLLDGIEDLPQERDLRYVYACIRVALRPVRTLSVNPDRHLIQQ